MFFDVAHFWTFSRGKVARYVEIFNSAIARDQQDSELGNHHKIE